MALTQVGSAADEAARDSGTTRRPGLLVPRPANADDSLLDAIRSSLAPRDPVAGLLARWPAPPVRAVEVVSRRRDAQLPGPA